MNTVIQFSGGRTSGYLLRHLLDLHGGRLPADWRVCFENTGKEREETLVFIEECSQRWGVPIVWLEFDDAFDFSEYELPDGELRTRKERAGVRYRVVNFETASRQGEPFLKLLRMLREYRARIKQLPPVLPNPAQRICTAWLKVKLMWSYMHDQSLEDQDVYMGIRADEADRAAKIQATCYSNQEFYFPLIPLGITKQDVNAFWRRQSFDLGLDPNGDQGNCDLCFLKATGKLVQIMKADRTREQWWINCEKEFQGTFSKNKKSFQQLARMIDAQDDQLSLFETNPLDKTIDCFCGE